eukprot:1106277-Alexandrium_andersonii.AAC.1
MPSGVATESRIATKSVGDNVIAPPSPSAKGAGLFQRDRDLIAPTARRFQIRVRAFDLPATVFARGNRLAQNEAL